MITKETFKAVDDELAEEFFQGRDASLLEAAILKKYGVAREEWKKHLRKKEAAFLQGLKDKGISTLKIDAFINFAFSLPLVPFCGINRVKKSLNTLGFASLPLNHDAHEGDYDNTWINADYVIYETTLKITITDDIKSLSEAISDLLKEKVYALLSRRKRFEDIVAGKTIEFGDAKYGLPELGYSRT